MILNPLYLPQGVTVHKHSGSQGAPEHLGLLGGFRTVGFICCAFGRPALALQSSRSLCGPCYSKADEVTPMLPPCWI